ncbi:MAG: hypothetical protein ACKOXB_00775 [Flavobacteriales bacterium]
MFIKTLKNNDFLSYILFGILFIGFALQVFSLPVAENFYAFTRMDELTFHSDTLLKIFFLLQWLFSVYWMDRTVKKFKLMDKQGGTVIFLFALLSFAFWSKEVSLDLQLALFFLILCIDQLFAIYQSQGKLYQSLNLGLIFGVAVYCYFPLVVLFPWLLMALGIVKSFQWRDVVLPLLGLLLPFYLYSVFQFFNDSENILFTKSLLALNFNVMPALFGGLQFKVLWLSVLLLLLLALMYSYRVMDKMTVKIRMIHSIMIWFTMFSVVLLFFTHGQHMESVFLLLPAVFLGANYLNAVKAQWIFNIAILLYLSLIIYLNLQA